MSAARSHPDAESLAPFVDHDAEATVLSAVLLDATALPKVVDFLLPSHFGSEAHRQIFDAVREVFFAKDPVDAQTVASKLRARGRLSQVGGVPYIGQVMAASPAVSNVRAHAVAVHDAWRRREVMLVCKRLTIQSCTSVPDVQAWCEGAARTLGEITLENPVRPLETSEQALARVLQDALRPDGEAPPPGTVALTGFPVGLFGIDRLLGGLRKSAKTTIAATTGVGKTAFAIQAAVALAKQGVGVLMFSKELKRAEVMRRALLQEANVSGNRWRDRRLTAGDLKALREATERLRKLPLVVDETPKLTIEQISAVAKSEAERILHTFRVPLGMIIDDYVQRCEPSRHLVNREKHEQVGHHTKNFKTLCQELDVVGLELAQQKDPIAGRKPEKPRAGSAIADSSQIGKEADDIVYLLRDGERAPNDPRQPIIAWIAKNRAGPVNEAVSLVYRGDTYTFTDPNTPNSMASPSRQYIDHLSPPPGRFDDEEDS